MSCRLQIYTPPYLTGNVSRPIISSLSNNSPGYGASVNINFAWTGAAGTVNRVVVNRVGGVTHSLHVDQRQASQPFMLSVCANNPGKICMNAWMGAAETVNKVVVNRVDGVTHSLHADQRQASQQCLRVKMGKADICVNISFAWMGVVGIVNRVVVDRIGGVTHSLHVD